MVAYLFIGIAAGTIIGAVLYYIFTISRQKRMKVDARSIIENARKEAENLKRENLLKAREEAAALKEEIEKELKERRQEVQRIEERVMKREENLDRKFDEIEKKEAEVNKKKEEIDNLHSKTEELYKQQIEELQKVSGMSVEQAKELLMEKVERESKLEAARILKREEEKAHREAEKKSREIISSAIQRYANDLATETTVSVVNLPSDDMKGRIIGREGRNIRAFENLTGINLIIDDTPEAVTLSSFDPIRREISRRTLEKLIVDGRIHPARIEEIYSKVKDEIEDEFREVGEEAVFEVGLTGIHPEIVKLLGKLKFRTSYGQNVLKHSIEVAYFAGMMASELNLDEKLAKKAGLLHDIGKAVDHEVEGPHAKIGADIARRHKETEDVINAIEAHHEEAAFKTIEAVLVQASDAISASRPGARRETLESYIKRLESLENIAGSYDGVNKCYAMQAGREIRVIVKPDQVSDEEADIMARDLSKKIETEMNYPGQIKVTLVREHRAVEYAK